MSTAPLSASRRVELIVLLGALTAFAPIAIDMYLPALPAIAREFGAPIASAEHSLSAFFFGFAIGQAFYGPLTDRFGRKPPLYAGLLIFTLASFACAFASSADLLILMRFLQALGASAGVVVARACVRDFFPPQDAPRVFAHMMLVLGAAPLLAPLLGGYILIGFGWRAIFILQGVLGLFGFAVVYFRLTGTHTGAHRALHPFKILRDFGILLSDRRFSAYAFAAAASNAGLFAYITASPHVFINIYHVPAEQFGWFFGGIACALIVASQVAARLLHLYSAQQVLVAAQILQLLSGVALVGFAASGFGGIWTISFCLMLYVGFNGAVTPAASGLAMAPFGLNAGMASALLGTVQFSGAALVSLGVGATSPETAIPMALIIALCAGIGTVVTLVFAQRKAL